MAADNVLRVLAWPGYADADVVKTFEARYNAKVEVTLVDSDEALWAQMHAQGTPQFDVLAANTAEIERYTRANLLAPLDLASLPNTKKQLPRFQALSAIEGLTSAGNVYAIPFTYSSMGLIYDRKQIAVAPRSMRELWNPRYRGKVLDFNSAMLTTDARGTGDKNALTFCGGGAIDATDKSNYPGFMRVAFRSSLRADYTTNNLGFRCAADEEAPR